MDAVIQFLNRITADQCLFGLSFLPIYGKLFGLNVVVIYYAGMLGALAWFVGKIRDGARYSKYLLLRFGYVLIGGMFNSGKTRLLTKFAESVKDRAFVCANYYYGRNFCAWSSKADLSRLMDDLLKLGEMQNFSKDERREIRKQFPMFPNEKEITAFKKKYRHINIDDGYHYDFFLPADEFHQYFINRDAMMNFTGEMGKRFNQTLHQVRHFNVLCALATQEIDILDLKFRQLAGYEIDTIEYLGGLVYGYNFFNYIPNKRNTKEEEDARQFRKVNYFPILFVNWYMVNKIMRSWEKTLQKASKYFMFNKGLKSLEKAAPRAFSLIFRMAEGRSPASHGLKWFLDFCKGEAKLPHFDRLPFNTKYNVNVFTDTYQTGDIFDKLNRFFKECEEPQNYLRLNS